MKVSAGRWQLVLHRRWMGLGSSGPFPATGRARGCIYSHRVRLGVVEIRRLTYRMWRVAT